MNACCTRCLFLLHACCTRHACVLRMLPVACVNPLEVFSRRLRPLKIMDLAGPGVALPLEMLKSQRGSSPRWAGNGACGLAVVVVLSRWLRTAGGSWTGERGRRTPRDPSSRYTGAVLIKPARGPQLVANPRCSCSSARRALSATVGGGVCPASARAMADTFV